MLDNTADWLPEVLAPDEAVFMMQRCGFAIWRGLLTPEYAEFLFGTARETAAGIRHNGALRLATPRLQELLKTERIAAVFDKALGAHQILDGSWTNIFLFAGPQYRGTAWHQENETVRCEAVIAWVALTDCGEVSPGLGMVLHQPNALVRGLYHDTDEDTTKDARIAELGWHVAYPKFKAGDAVFFTPYSIHKTHVTAEMTDERVAYKLTACRA